MLKMPPSVASGICMLAGARRTSCIARQHMHRDAGGADRVALGLEAAGGVDRQLAVLLRPAFRDGARALPSGVRPIASYSISSAMVKQSCVSTKERSSSVTPACSSARCQASAQPSNFRMSRFDIGRKSCTCGRGAEGDGAAHAPPPSPRRPAPAPPRRRRPASSRCASAARRRRGSCSLSCAAEVEAEILAHLRIGIGDAVACGSWRRSCASASDWSPWRWK